MTKVRRYETEFLLNTLIVARYQARQKDLRIKKLESEHPLNLYVVSQAARISIDPGSVTFTTQGELFVTLRKQIENAFAEYPVHIKRFIKDTRGLKWHSDWPHDEFLIFDAEDNLVTGGPVSTFFRAISMLPEGLMNQEVLYIGQAFGKAGERNAYDRLLNHPTLQRIYSENPPDKEIWLSFCSIDDVTLNTVIGKPGGVIQKSKEENNKHIDRVFERYQSEDFWSREVITGAEAGLIRYFQPQYNIIFKNNFPDPAHIHLARLYELELHTMIIEFQSDKIDVKFGSSMAKPDDIHFAYYPLGDLADPFNF